MTTYEMVAHFSDEPDGDVAGYYIDAQLAGLEVSHYSDWRCEDYSGGPTGDVLGMFRSIGSLIFHKDERRWEVRARSDCSPRDLSTLIAAGLRVIEKYGRRPGHWTRKKSFVHMVSKRTGKRIALAPICRRLGENDLRAQATAAVEIDFDDLSVADLRELAIGCDDQILLDVLRRAIDHAEAALLATGYADETDGAKG